MNPDRGVTERGRLETLIAADTRALTAESDQMGRVFAAVHRLRPSDFRALLHILVAGHIRRDSDPAERRKVILRYAELDLDMTGDFFAPLAAHTNAAMADLPDADLTAAHRVLTALVDGMRRFHNEVRVFSADVGTT